jgi:hypothetical protein
LITYVNARAGGIDWTVEKIRNLVRLIDGHCLIRASRTATATVSGNLHTICVDLTLWRQAGGSRGALVDETPTLIEGEAETTNLVGGHRRADHQALSLIADRLDGGTETARTAVHFVATSVVALPDRYRKTRAVAAGGGGEHAVAVQLAAACAAHVAAVVFGESAAVVGAGVCAQL